MAFLEGLPPLPKGLSGVTLINCNTLPNPYSSYPSFSDKNILEHDNNIAFNTSPTRDIGSTNMGGKTYCTSTPLGFDSKSKTSQNMRDSASNLALKLAPETSPLSSNRVSPMINSSKSTPQGSSRGSPNILRGYTPPASIIKGTTSLAGLRNLISPASSIRHSHNQLNTINGIESNSVTRPDQLFHSDAQLATLKKEMFSLRQMDLSLLNQLWSINEAIQDLRNLQEEHASTFPSSPGEDSDEFYSPLSTLRYKNVSTFQNEPFMGKLSSSSSDSSVEFGDV